MLQLFEKILAFLNREQIPYMLSGSMAMSIYVLPRATRDFDFVVHLQPLDIPKLLREFGEGFYCDEASIEDAIRRKSMFNIIDHRTGFKADFVVLKDDAFRQKEFNRRLLSDFHGNPIWVVTPEDLLLSKLIWIQDYQSSIQMEDIRQLAALPHLDIEYVQNWVHSLQLRTFHLI
jgi:hypothetical protein